MKSKKLFGLCVALALCCLTALAENRGDTQETHPTPYLCVLVGGSVQIDGRHEYFTDFGRLVAGESYCITNPYGSLEFHLPRSFSKVYESEMKLQPLKFTGRNGVTWVFSNCVARLVDDLHVFGQVSRVDNTGVASSNHTVHALHEHPGDLLTLTFTRHEEQISRYTNAATFLKHERCSLVFGRGAYWKRKREAGKSPFEMKVEEVHRLTGNRVLAVGKPANSWYDLTDAERDVTVEHVGSRESKVFVENVYHYGRMSNLPYRTGLKLSGKAAATISQGDTIKGPSPGPDLATENEMVSGSDHAK